MYMKRISTRHLPLLFLACACAGWLACNRVKDTVLPHTELIFPNEAGHTRISEVHDTTFTTAGIANPQTIAYYKRERLGRTETDLQGREVRLVEVSRSPLIRPYDFAPDRIWYQYFAPQTGANYYAERIEENRRTLVLRFPVTTVTRWNGNLYNALGTEIFSYGALDTTVTVKGQTFENCVMVIQKLDTTGFIIQEFAYEIYAPGIGLIKKYDKTLVFDQPDGDGFNPDASRIYLEEYIGEE
ncbi:MAG: hypothetical protein OHK0039_25320 [Bacteroidia bacterium]